MTLSYSVLITNTILTGRTGTETFVQDLALGLLARGHRPMVYCPELGPIARVLESHGVPVVSDLAELPRAPDVIHGHHHAETVEAMLAHPGCPGIFVCHDRTSDTDVPPLLERIGRYVAVDRNCLERLIAFGVDPKRCELIFNAVDLERFRPRPASPPRPSRAAVFGNNAGRLWSVDPIAEACRDRDIELDVIGYGLGRETAEPEAILARYDLVFAKGRCALEALATGCAVVCCDYPGLGPLVTTENAPHLREWNFGWRTLAEPHEASRVRARIDAYDAADVERVRDLIRASASLSASIDAYLALYAAVIADADRSGHPRNRELRSYIQASIRALRRTDDSVPELALPLDAPRRDAIVITLRSCPARVELLSGFEAVVEVSNPTDETLRTLVSSPLALSYHWLDDASGAIVEWDGVRTAMAPVGPGVSAARRLRVRAPDRAGRFRLVLTLLYEYLAWFDDGGRCRTEAVVDVVEPSSSTAG